MWPNLQDTEPNWIGIWNLYQDLKNVIHNYNVTKKKIKNQKWSHHSWRMTSFCSFQIILDLGPTEGSIVVTQPTYENSSSIFRSSLSQAKWKQNSKTIAKTCMELLLVWSSCMENLYGALVWRIQKP